MLKVGHFLPNLREILFHFFFFLIPLKYSTCLAGANYKWIVQVPICFHVKAWNWILGSYSASDTIFQKVIFLKDTYYREHYECYLSKIWRLTWFHCVPPYTGVPAHLQLCETRPLSQSPFYSHIRHGARNMEDTGWQTEGQPNLTNHIQSKALGTHEHKHSRKQEQTEKWKGKLQQTFNKNQTEQSMYFNFWPRWSNRDWTYPCT